MPPILALLFLLAAPLAVLAVNSLVEARPGEVGGWPPTLDNYVDILTDGRYWRILWRTVWLSVLSTVIACLLSFPVALAVVFSHSRVARSLYLMAGLSPLLVSVVLRTFGWQIVLGAGGPLAEVMTSLFGDQWILGFRGRPVATVIGFTHILVPLVLLGLLPTMDRIDSKILDAAESLGAGRTTICWRIIFPLCREGLLAGGLIAFALSMTAYTTPALLTGRQYPVFSILIRDANSTTLDWSLGAALSMILLFVVVVGASSISYLGRRDMTADNREPEIDLPSAVVEPDREPTGSGGRRPR